MGINNLTLAQATRDPDDVRREDLLSKTKSGEKLLEIYEEQRIMLLSAIDKFIDDDAKADSKSDFGEIFSEALERKHTREKGRVKYLYKTARKSPEGNEKVLMKNFANYLNRNEPEVELNKIMKFARKAAIKTGVLSKNENGDAVTAIASKNSLKNIEELRKAINKQIKLSDSTSTYYGGQLKRAIDRDIEKSGGKLYKEARAARRKLAIEYENVALVNKLVEKGKDGEPIINAEKTVDELVKQGTSRASLIHLKKLLLAPGQHKESGRLAWTEFQAAVIKHIRDKSLTTDQSEGGHYKLSSPRFHAELKKLKVSGKLEVIFGKKTADELLTLDKVAQDLFRR